MADEDDDAQQTNLDEAGVEDASVVDPTVRAAPVKAAPPAEKAPLKRAPTTKKAPVRKKAPPKKAGAKKSVAQTAAQAKFPRHSVEKALRVPKAIYDQNAGKPTTLADAAKFTTGGKVNGPFTVLVSSAKKYGFLKSEGGKVVPEDRARQALAPQSETDRLSALREAVLAAPDLADVYSHYRGENLPDDQFFKNALVDRFRIPEDKVAEFLEVFYESMRSAELIDESGERPRLIDVGRDEALKPSGSLGPKIAVAEGTTCFVMQPFGGHLGTYYETIFKPAIKQAGLTPVRADDDIFATGKIMDQVWRGIRQAKVLLAELTSKNPNVFYELGLAHALEKPVILEVLVHDRYGTVGTAPQMRPAGKVLTAMAAVLAATIPLARTTSNPAPDAWSPQPATYGRVTEANVGVRTADGTVLRADVHCPVDRAGHEAGGPFPVLLQQTPYGKEAIAQSARYPGTANLAATDVDYLVDRGFIVVIADVRGTGGSGGTWGLLDQRRLPTAPPWSPGPPTWPTPTARSACSG
jgi:hypothetical protein